MAELRPAYLIHGEDHGRIAERRARLRGLAERGAGASGWELLEGDAASPEAVAVALSSLTLSLGRRIVIVDGAERYTDAAVQEHLASVLTDMPGETTVAFFAREEGRRKAPARLHELVRGAGGEVAEEATVKPWKLAEWTRAQAAAMGLGLDAPAARALVEHVGERQQRLLRELEKLSVERGAGATVGEEDVEARAAHSAERRVWVLADAVLAADGPVALRVLLGLRAQGERLGGMQYWLAQRLRQALEIAERLQAGEAPAQVKRGLRMPPRAADRLIADARRSDPAQLRRALGLLADLELDTRGGPALSGPARRRAALGEETLAVLAVEGMTAPDG